ncbi:MAG: AMIN domain-containing protein [Deltaproteobacteria bacterium]|nr:AMIN domain-containing protein [Deltaproteobacteria bacterium]
MKRCLLLALVLLHWSSPGFAREAVRGHYCYSGSASETLEEIRTMTRTLALWNAVESLAVFRGPGGALSDLRTRTRLLQILCSGYAEDIRIVEHTEEGKTVCEAVEMTIDTESFRLAFERETKRIREEAEVFGVDNNGWLKILRVAERERDRYGERIGVVVKVLRRTGPLYTDRQRNTAPCFRICMDYLDAQGCPLNGESRFIHESEQELVAGEIRTLDFYAPPGTASYRAWLAVPGKKQAETSRVRRSVTVAALPPPPAPKASPAASQGSPSLRLDQIRPSSSEGRLRLEFITNHPVGRHRDFIMDDPPRLVIDLPGAWLDPRRGRLVLESPLAKGIRIGRHPEKLRVVVDLVSGVPLGPITIEHPPQGVVVTLTPSGAARP